ncbi:helix-turn-helix domain-containing protein [Nocardia sp. NPDC049190]|uniref:helix-turn-helix domain-containing protein n=1 Tax=Nocardia sp. NPDC049190 TaxID=3155650 RepID=UPI00340F6D7B
MTTQVVTFGLARMQTGVTLAATVLPWNGAVTLRFTFPDRAPRLEHLATLRPLLDKATGSNWRVEQFSDGNKTITAIRADLVDEQRTGGRDPAAEPHTPGTQGPDKPHMNVHTRLFDGAQLRTARERMNLTQQQFAEAIRQAGQKLGEPNNCTNGEVSKWESGRHLPGPRYQRALTEVTGEHFGSSTEPAIMGRLSDGERLRAARKGLNLSQDEFAAEIRRAGQELGRPNDCSRHAIQNWEDNRTSPGWRYRPALELVTGERFGPSTETAQTTGTPFAVPEDVNTQLSDGERVRAARERMGLSQSEFVDEIRRAGEELGEPNNFTRRQLSMWESGQSTPRPHYLRALEEVTGEHFGSSTEAAFTKGLSDGGRLRAARERMNLTQQQFAEEIRRAGKELGQPNYCGSRAVQDWEHNRTWPGPRYQRALEAVTGERFGSSTEIAQMAETSFGARSRAARERLGMSQEEFAEALQQAGRELGEPNECGRQLVGEWEAGRVTPGPRYRRALEAVTGEDFGQSTDTAQTAGISFGSQVRAARIRMGLSQEEFAAEIRQAGEKSGQPNNCSADAVQDWESNGRMPRRLYRRALEAVTGEDFRSWTEETQTATEEALTVGASFGTRVRAARERLDLSQEEFAAEIQRAGQESGQPNNCSPMMVSRWERDQVMPQARYRRALEAVTGEDFRPPTEEAPATGTSFGARLHFARERMGLSMEELAVKIREKGLELGEPNGCTKQLVSKWEKDRVTPGPRYQRALTAIMGEPF